MIGSLNLTQIEHLLQSEMTARLACYADDKTYVVPITYVYEDGYVYGHTREGMKVEMMRKNPNVCLEIDHVYNLANWQSVIAWGRYEELTGRKSDEALQKVVNRIHPFSTGETSLPRHGLDRPNEPIDPNIRLVIFRIKLTERTGRFEKQ